MSKAVEKAQKRVEEHNFEIRKNLIKYDEVMNQQREVIYSYRRNVLKGYDLNAEIMEMIQETVFNLVEENTPEGTYPEDWNLERICYWLKSSFNIHVEVQDLDSDHLNRDLLNNVIMEYVSKAYQNKERSLGEATMRDIERRSLLEVVDDEWRDHLHEMDLLKEGVHLRAYANKDPLIEYKRESFGLFEGLIRRIQENVSKKVFNTYILTKQQVDSLLGKANMSHEEINAFLQAENMQTQNSTPLPYNDPYGPPPEAPKGRPISVAPKVGRNDPCPCGSGKKYKKCCGKDMFED